MLLVLNGGEKLTSVATEDQRGGVYPAVYSRYGAVFALLSLLGSSRAHGGCESVVKDSP